MMTIGLIKKGFSKAFAVLAACSVMVMPVMAAPTVDDLKKEKKDAESEVNSLQEELTEMIGKISRLERDLVAKGEEIIEAEKDLKEAEKTEKKQYKDMKLRIKFMYEEGDTGAVETLIASESFTDFVNKAEYVRSVHSYDREKLTEYAETKNRIASLKSTLETEQGEMEMLQEEQKEHREALDSMIESKKAEVADLDQQIQAAVEAAARAERERQAAEAAARAERERQAAAAAAAAANNPGNQQTQESVPGQEAPEGQQQTPQPDQSEPVGGAASPGDGSAAQAIVSAAYSQLGVPYVWGGNTPGGGLDCSGLVMYCHSVAGISIARYSETQYANGMKVSSPQPGDICWTPGHVAIYIGGGQMIEAQQPGTNIMISPVRASGYARYW